MEAMASESGRIVLVGTGPGRRLVLPGLAGVEGLAHGFTVRGSTLEIAAREAAGAPLSLHTLRQVHGRVVHLVDGCEDRSPSLEGDALITARPALGLAVFVADCVPILLCDPRTRGIAAVHAGWRGTAAGILEAAIEVLRSRLGARPADLLVGIGPAIGACCYEVGDEVVTALLQRDPGAKACVREGGKRTVDLVAANRRQAIAAGVPAARIEAAGLCTRCRADLLESYRRSGPGAGRMAALIAWKTA
jgi:YfiH family protein